MTSRTYVTLGWESRFLSPIVRGNDFMGFMKAQSSDYKTGDSDVRPWGSYEVTEVGKTPDGKDYCNKTIVVNPGQILSLQSHKHRQELWNVAAGVLTVICDGERKMLKQGQSVSIPLGAVHCMANLGDVPCVVSERQEGVCREDDITRYVDAYGRGVAQGGDKVRVSIALYEQILKEAGKSDG